MTSLDCPKGHGQLYPKRVTKNIVYKGVPITFKADEFKCPTCGLEAGTPQTAGTIQQAIADAYRTQKDLLTGKEIKEFRKACEFTQKQLADAMGVGLASIKRWETGTVQSKSMDRALRRQFQAVDCSTEISGNRKLSIPRIKLVAKTFEKALGKRLLKKTDKMLFAAKYVWYADMVAARELGRSMTGATYAALPYGPQLNNYRDLLDEIKAANTDTTEPLSQEEVQIITKIAKKFPEERMVYDAAHREKVWEKTETGRLISYSCAHDLTEV